MTNLPARELLLFEAQVLALLTAGDALAFLGIAVQLEAHDPLKAPGTVTAGGVGEAVFLDVEGEDGELGGRERSWGRGEKSWLIGQREEC